MVWTLFGIGLPWRPRLAFSFQSGPCPFCAQVSRAHEGCDKHRRQMMVVLGARRGHLQRSNQYARKDQAVGQGNFLPHEAVHQNCLETDAITHSAAIKGCEKANQLGKA